VALSGEGLDEVTYRYEAFAQRHVAGLDHTNGTWVRPWLESAHPISSYIMRPQVRINGYLGMASPANAQLYAAWREAYNHWGIIPTFAWPDAATLAKPEGFTAQLLDEIRYFQQHRLDLDMDGPWAGDTIFPYKGEDGTRARYKADSGWELVSGTPEQTVARTISGVSEVTGPGSIAQWLVYDDQKIMGLSTDYWYPFMPTVPRDMSAFHVSKLPASVRIERATTGPNLTALTTGAADSSAQWVADLIRTARAGYVLDNGATYQQEGEMPESPSGASFSAANQRTLHAHPGWKGVVTDPDTGQESPGGVGTSFAVMDVKLPAITGAGNIVFRADVALDPNAVVTGKSDGALFIVQATGGTQVAQNSVLWAKAERQPLELDLTPFVGQTIELKLMLDPGPQRDPTYDWARWFDARIESKVTTSDTLRIVTSDRPQLALASTGDCWMTPAGENAFDVSMNLPGTLYLLKEQPQPVTVPLDLAATPFEMSFVSHSGAQLMSPQYADGSAGETEAAGVRRRGMHAHPPDNGATIMDFPMQLPAGPLTFRCTVGLRNDSKSEGCIFIVQVNGHEVARQRIVPEDNWKPLEADLSPWAGQPVVLSLVADSEATFGFDWMFWERPRIE
jgi:hypothetical protein